RCPAIESRSYHGITSSRTTTAAMSAVDFQTPKSAISASEIPTHMTALTARRVSFGSASQRSRGNPTAASAAHHAAVTRARRRRRTSGAFRCPLAEETLGAEDEDQDQDREHDRLRPVAARHVPGQAVVVRLDEADRERAEHGAGQVADAAEDGGGERDQPQLEAGVVADLVEVQRVQEAAGARE